MKTLRYLLPASLLLFGASACVLAGIEPDEIDVADEETGGVDTGLTGAGTEGDGADDRGGDGDGDGDNGTDEGDPAGDGDSTGDGDPGDGDGDPTGDGDGDPMGDGDGDSEGLDCFGLEPEELSEGANPVAVVEGDSELSSSCGGAGPETVYQFTAPAEGDWQFAIAESDFTEVLTLLGSCEPLEELSCSAAPAVVEQPLSEGEVVYVIVDSEQGTGAASLVISQL
ncbi:MAG: hypothetical protein R6X02_11210 [Enhygromyxa sp.]